MADNTLAVGNPTTRLQTPLESLGQVTQVVNALAAYKGRQAVGNALQQATDSDTGQLDPLKFNKLVAADPNARFGMQDAASQSQQLQGQQQGLQQSRSGVIGSMLGSVLAMPDGQLHDGAASALDRAVTMGLVPQTQATALAMKLPSDPGALRQTLGQMQLSMQSPGEQTQQIYGTPTQQSNGQDLISGVTAPARAGGGFSGTSATPLVPSRSELLQQVPTQNAQGQPELTPAGVVANRQGAGALTGPAGAALPGRGLPAGLVPPGYTGRYAPPKADGSIAAGPMPGTVQAAAKTAEAGADQGIALQQSSDNSPTRLGMLGNMMADLQGFTPGPGQTRETYLQNFAQRYAPDLAKSFGMDPQRVASAESFEKLATNLATQQAQTLGNGTDAKLDAAIHGNPHGGMSKMGATQILQMLQGNEDAIVAKNKAWQTYQGQNGAGSYGTFSTQFNQAFDPRAFQAGRLDPADRARMLEGMPPSERNAFRAKVNTMVKSGLIPDPRTPAAGAPNGQ